MEEATKAGSDYGGVGTTTSARAATVDRRPPRPSPRLYAGAPGVRTFRGGYCDTLAPGLLYLSQGVFVLLGICCGVGCKGVFGWLCFGCISMLVVLLCVFLGLPFCWVHV